MNTLRANSTTLTSFIFMRIVKMQLNYELVGTPEDKENIEEQKHYF